ncbi:hypothetical protein [Lutibacter sp.]|uniref:hypothetical protein n=1 Tax=Lutibacter sp. TaxID=1925666 RepID=UPI002735DB56|nr:hypothetical protein [Lutibacter sp.]MDP3314384.1 hypothetical protein [Lutibacter sp.]
MDSLFIVFAGVIALVFFVIFSFLAGRGFREWNEGTNNVKDNKQSNTKTLIIGLIIGIVLLFIFSKCNS